MGGTTVILPTPMRTRIAPTPSGYLHMGNAFNFLLTFKLARANGGTVRLRIDDVDATRMRPEYLADVFDTLDWLGLAPDEGPSGVEDFLAQHSQQHRMAQYRGALERLLALGKAYACRCSRKQIKEASPNGLYPGTCRPLARTAFAGEAFALRAALDEHALAVGHSAWPGEATPYALAAEMGDFVLWRKDGLAAYQLASVLDDEAQGINFIVRGQDLQGSTAAQLWLARQLGLEAFPRAVFHHHGLLTEASGAKLSKSEGALALKTMRQQGTSAQELIDRFEAWYQTSLA